MKFSFILFYLSFAVQARSYFFAHSIFPNENGHFLSKRANKEKKLNTFTALEKEMKNIKRKRGKRPTHFQVAWRQNLTCFWPPNLVNQFILLSHALPLSLSLSHSFGPGSFSLFYPHPFSISHFFSVSVVKNTHAMKGWTCIYFLRYNVCKYKLKHGFSESLFLGF